MFSSMRPPSTVPSSVVDATASSAPSSCRRRRGAQANLEEAGLVSFAEIRVGDARETLRADLGEPTCFRENDWINCFRETIGCLSTWLITGC